ncbi:hypothetical protein M2317_003526 [Microbacterium sp. ZKA21]|uniref:hypothetical protein n=1 Tax=Microbacterium sp. ZKA21 TaxID=3381694 RepID=UPI003D1E7CDA
MTEPPLAPAATSHRLPAFGIGAAGAVLGLLPWLVAGTLPLQNLWATQTMPEDMPYVLLPLSQYYATMLFSLVLLGGVFAGLAVRVARRGRAVSMWPAALGVALVHLIAAAQSFVVLARGLGLMDGSGDTRAALYFGGMLGGTVVAAVLAQVGLWMTSRPSVAVASLGIALAAVPFGTWVVRWFAAFAGPSGPWMVVSSIGYWLPAVVVGVALVWCGVRPVGRLAVWAIALLSVWVVPAVFTAIGYGLGMRVLQGDVREMAEASMQVFPSVMAEMWRPVVLAVLIAVVGSIVRVAVAKRSARLADAAVTS